MNGVGTFLIGLVMVVGVVGTILPFLPGLLLVWAAALVYGIVDGFDPVAVTAFVVITMLTVAGKVLSWLLPTRRGTAAGATPATLVVGAVGAVIGAFAIPVVGLLIGGLAGILLAELVRLGNLRAAWRTTTAVLVGFGIGAGVELAAGMSILIVWLLWVILG